VTQAAVFAYSEVGARCLEALLDAGVRVPLVATHGDDPREQRWFRSVAEIARAAGSEVCLARPESDELERALVAAAPDFLFSFYYRHLLSARLLAHARRGALNMHGSLLPKYRGRAPVNWAVLMGETETGASLHYMVEKPDAGALVDQEAVPIGPDDTGFEIAGRVAEAAVVVLRRSLPALIAGTAAAVPLDLRQGSYFGGRRPEDGEFQWTWPAARIHNLVRAVAPPFPGAFGRLGGLRLDVHRTRRDAQAARHPELGPCLYGEAERLVAECGDGHRLVLDIARLDDEPLPAARFRERFGAGPVRPNSLTA
jgi:methionyl-tRNA formyltransferase